MNSGDNESRIWDPVSTHTETMFSQQVKKVNPSNNATGSGVMASKWNISPQERTTIL